VLDGCADGVSCWGALSFAVKTLALEDIYADPHKLDSYLESGEVVALVRDGKAVAEFVPQKTSENRTTERPAVDYRERFLKMWGAEAFSSDTSVAEKFAELRQGRVL
jgi:hypothetical protein